MEKGGEGYERASECVVIDSLCRPPFVQAGPPAAVPQLPHTVARLERCLRCVSRVLQALLLLL